MILVRSIADALQRRASVADDAAQWLAIVTDSACTAQERQRFIAWLKRSNLHVEEFLRISALTQRLRRSDLWPPNPAELERSTSDDLEAPARRPPAGPSLSAARKPRGPAYWVMTACGVLATAIVALLLGRLDRAGWFAPTYTTSVGELRSLTLEDGSVVELNTQSRVRTRYTPTERRVELLRGEAIFRVSKNLARPFRVAAGNAEIVAVGTAFNVYAQRSRTVVTVLEGRVRVSDRAAGPDVGAAAPRTNLDIELARGEQAVVGAHGPIVRTKLADPARVASWTERRLTFEDTPLDQVANEFARYNRKLIRIDDPSLAQLRITGVFDATDPASLVQFVEAYAGVHVRRDGRGWILESARTFK